MTGIRSTTDDSIKTRAAVIETGDKCFCGRPSRASTRHGLDRYCEAHSQWISAHGALAGSYSFGEVGEYRKLVKKWLRKNRHHPALKTALARIETYFKTAGPDRTYRAKAGVGRPGLPLEERVKCAWARLRDRPVDPKKILVFAMAVLLCHREYPRARGTDYLKVQLGRVVHTLAASQTRSWQQQRLDGSIRTVIEKSYERPAGMYIRQFGAQVFDVVDAFPEAVLVEMRGTADICTFYSSCYPEGVAPRTHSRTLPPEGVASRTHSRRPEPPPKPPVYRPFVFGPSQPD